MSMAVETLGFFAAALGLLLLGVTLPNSYWRVSTIHGNVITTNTIFENLWYSCATDSLGVSNCWEFPSMLALSGRPWRGAGREGWPGARHGSGARVPRSGAATGCHAAPRRLADASGGCLGRPGLGSLRSASCARSRHARAQWHRPGPAGRWCLFW